MWHSFNYSCNNNSTNCPNNSEINNSDMSTGTVRMKWLAMLDMQCVVV